MSDSVSCPCRTLELLLMQELVEKFRAGLRDRYGRDAESVERVVCRILGLWEKVRRAFYLEGDHHVMVLPIEDPALKWSRQVLSSLIVPSIQGDDDRQSSLSRVHPWLGQSFVFEVDCSKPGVEGEEVLRAIVESMAGASFVDWAIAKGMAHRDYRMEGCSAEDKLQRLVWGGINWVRELTEFLFSCDEPIGPGFAESMSRTFEGEEVGDGARPGDTIHMEVLFPRRGFVPFFLVYGGENLSDLALYTLQGLAVGKGCRFLVVANVAMGEGLHWQLANGDVDPDFYEALPHEEPSDVGPWLRRAEIEAGNLIAELEEMAKRNQPVDEMPLGMEPMEIPFTLSAALFDCLCEGV